MSLAVSLAVPLAVSLAVSLCALQTAAGGRQSARALAARELAAGAGGLRQAEGHPCRGGWDSLWDSPAEGGTGAQAADGCRGQGTDQAGDDGDTAIGALQGGRGLQAHASRGYGVTAMGCGSRGLQPAGL